MTFNYELFERYEFELKQTHQGRFYETPWGCFPSVTSTLARKLHSKKLDEWRERVGSKEADHISELAKSFGTTMHELCENYLLGKKLPKLMPSNQALFSEIKPILNKNITKIFGVELALASPRLQVAGRTDGLVEWLGRNVVLDFKTAQKRLDKHDERLQKYHLQATTYAMMAEELYKKSFPYNVIFVIPKDFDFPQVNIKTNSKYRPFVEKLFNDK